jgi:hypothetical protein
VGGTTSNAWRTIYLLTWPCRTSDDQHLTQGHLECNQALRAIP